MMLRRILFLIIFNSLIFSSGYSNISNVELAYYENNKWDFIEQKFVNNVDSMNHINIKGMVALVSLLGLGWIAAEKYLKDDETVRYLCRTIVPLIGIMYALIAFGNNNIKKLNLLNVMDDFFKNYSRDLNSKLEINYRKFVPHELLSTFDAIYDSYKKEGSGCLNSFVDIFNNIRNKFVLRVETYKHKI
ncbi:MAG: hypothetical protein ABIF12_00385 [bacterium]